MYIYYILIIYFIISFAAISTFNGFDKRKIFTLLLAFGTFNVLALRKYTVGVDVERYIDFYKNIDQFYLGFDLDYEPGYMLFLSLLNVFGVSGQGYIAIVSFIIVFAFSLFIYRYSRNILFSFYIHITFGLFVFSMSALRQAIAISIVLFAINYLFKRKFLPFIVIIGVAISFHYSAVIFIPMYFIYGLKVNSYSKVFILLTSIIFLLLIGSMFTGYLHFLSTEKYTSRYIEGVDQYGINPLIILISAIIPLTIVVIWRLKSSSLNNISNQDSFFFISICIAFFFTVYSLNVHMLIRFSSYFVPAYLIIIPNAISDLRNSNNRMLFYVLTIPLFFVYFILGTIGGILEVDNYKFFFQ